MELILTQITAPNLFDYATKELAQDATLAYILAWAHPSYQNKQHRPLNELGTGMLRAMLASQRSEFANLNVTSIEVKTQDNRIDVLARINDENKDGIVLLIEDKVDTHEHSNQIERYVEVARENYENREIVPVYVKTGNASQYALPPKEVCGRILRQDILQLLNQYGSAGDTIIDNFKRYLQKWEDETNGYLEHSVSKWSEDWKRYEGFYMELEKRMHGDSNQQWGEEFWEYVSNPSGGLLSFAFGHAELYVKHEKVKMYLQIECPAEGQTRLTLRIGIRDNSQVEKIDSNLMWKTFELLKKHKEGIERLSDLNISKAGRYRGGSSGAVAKFTFDDEENYLALKNDGILDLDSTMERLGRLRDFVYEVSKKTLELN